jgi:hypothetical protein
MTWREELVLHVGHQVGAPRDGHDIAGVLAQQREGFAQLARLMIPIGMQSKHLDPADCRSLFLLLS